MSATPCTAAPSRTLSRSPARSAGKPGLGQFLRFLLQLHDNRTQRRQLARLDDAALRDIGVTRDQARSEAARPAWDVPMHWQR